MRAELNSIKDGGSIVSIAFFHCLYFYFALEAKTYKHSRDILLTSPNLQVNAASVTGQIGMPTAAIYSASKFAVIGLTRAAAREAGSKNIRINYVAPSNSYPLCPLALPNLWSGS
jgi:NAD(P)-dependent dehydrogenase (short-subunit alcohol dehydrogenase family)